MKRVTIEVIIEVPESQDADKIATYYVTAIEDYLMDGVTVGEETVISVQEVQ